MNHIKAVDARYGGLAQRWLFVLLAFVGSLGFGPAQAARINNGIGVPGPTALFAPSPVPPQFDIVGFIQDATLDTVGANSMCPTVTDQRLMGGTVTLNGQVITVPCNTILQMPAFALTWADVFTMAPQDITPLGKSGLALSDPLSPGMSGALAEAATGLLNHRAPGATFTLSSAALPSHEIHVVGNVVGGKYIAGLIYIAQQSLNAGQGIISCIDYATGELQIGGAVVPLGASCPPVGPGVTRVRMNDPVGRFGIVHGGPGNTAADVIEPGYDARYTADTDNPTMHSAVGYPVCIPRVNPVNPIVNPINGATITAGTDPLCPMYNRPIVPNCNSYDPLTGIVPFGAQNPGYCTTWVMDAPGAHAINPALTDPTLAAPLVPGDTIGFHGTLKADANGGQYISANTIDANLGIYTMPHTSPSYVFVEALGVGTGGATVGGLAAETTTRLFWVGFSTDPTELVDMFAVHQDPVTGATSEYFIGTQNPCCSPLGRFRSVANNVGAFGEPQRNYRAVSRTACQPAGANGPTTLAVSSICHLDPLNAPVPVNATEASGAVVKTGNDLMPNQYTLPVFEFIFGENLAFGAPLVPLNLQDLPFLFCGSGPVGGPGSATSVVGQLIPAPWADPMPNPSAASTLCPTATKVGAAPAVVVTPTLLPAVINSLTATSAPAVVRVGTAATVTLSVVATNPNTPATALQYVWNAPAGIRLSCAIAPATNVCGPSASSTVTATFTPTAVGTLTFTSTVLNGVLPNATRSVGVAVVSNTATAPSFNTFVATPTTGITFGTRVTLTATGRTNTNKGSVSFSFVQTGGPAVTLATAVTTNATGNATGTTTFVAPVVRVATTLTFVATEQDSGGVALTKTLSVVVNPPPADTVTFICPTCGVPGTANYVQAQAIGGVFQQVGKLTVAVTSSATPVVVGGNMTATYFNSTLPATTPGSSALPMTLQLLGQPADPVGTLPGAAICGPTACWTGVALSVINNGTGALVPPTSITVTSPLGGRVTTTGASATGPIVIK